MKALTVRQPWASLIAADVKTIETRSWRTNYRGRIAIHAGRTKADPRDPAWEPLLDAPGSALLRADVRPLPLGAVVATAELVDCVPIVGSTEPPTPDDLIFRTIDGRNLFRQQTVGDPEIETNVRLTELTDQEPFGDFRPGRWAWLLDDIKPVNERCPWCWGARFACPQHGRLAICECPTVPVCRRCGGAGLCDPIPARGKQGLWELTL